MRLQLEDASTKIDPELSEGLKDERQRFESYVDQCLLIAWAERRQLSVEGESFQLSALIEDIVEPFTLLAREEGRELICYYGPGAQVVAVPWIIRQILHNFLSNAPKHSMGTIKVQLIDQKDTKVLTVSNPLKIANTCGTVLGLRIVDALIRCHGNLKYEYRSDGGHYRAGLVFESRS